MHAILDWDRAFSLTLMKSRMHSILYESGAFSPSGMGTPTILKLNAYCIRLGHGMFSPSHMRAP